jgi:hypothetical protein
MGFEKFERAIHNATFVLVVATPLYKAKYDAFKEHGRAKARSGVSDEMQMIEERLSNPKLQDGGIPVMLPGRVPEISVNPNNGNVSIWVNPDSSIDSGYQFLPKPLAGKFGVNCCDGKARQNTVYYRQSFHLLKTLYWIPQWRYSELKHYKKLFLKAQEIIFNLTETQIAPYQQKVDREKAEFDAEAMKLVSEGLSVPQGIEGKDAGVFTKYAQSDKEEQHERLLQAIYEGKSSMAAAMRISKQVDPHWTDSLGDTPLHVSAAQGDTEASDELLKAGIDIEVQNEDGNTPLSEAAVKSEVSTVSNLLAHGANPSTRNREQQRPLDRLISQFEANVSKVKLDPKNQEDKDRTAMALISAQAHQEQKTPEAFWAEETSQSKNPYEKAVLKSLEKQFSQTHWLALSAIHPDLGSLNFGLYQGKSDVDSPLRVLLGEDTRYGKPSEPFKRDVLIRQLREAINQPTSKAKSIKNLILRDMTAHYQAYHAELWQPLCFFPVNLQQRFTSPREDNRAPHFTDAEVSDYLNYLAKRQAGEAEPLMIGGFLDAAAAMSNQQVYYWQEQQGVLTCIHTFKPLQTEGKSRSMTIRHFLHQGIYFDELKLQTQAGILVTSRDNRVIDLIAGTVNEKLTSDYRWLLEMSYSRWERTQQDVPDNHAATGILENFERVLWCEAFVLYGDWQPTEKPAAAQRTSQAQSDLTPKPKTVTPKLSESKHTLTPKPKTYGDQVREKALSVANKITTQKFKELLRAASHFEPAKVKAMLDENRHLMYAQGDFDRAFEKTKDGQDKIYKNVTLFQYLWIIGDIKLLEAVMKYFSSEPKLRDAAIQALALDERKDIQLFTYDDTIKEYNNYITNYDDWDYDTCCHHWQKGVGGAQLTWPGYLVAQFTENGYKTSWTEKNISMECQRAVIKSNVGRWTSVILSGNGWTRGASFNAFTNHSARYTSILFLSYIDTNWLPHNSFLKNKYEQLIHNDFIPSNRLSFESDLCNCVLREEQQKAERSRLSSDFRNQLSQESKRITSDLNRQQPTC